MSANLTRRGKLLSLDAYRGFTMFLIASAGFGFIVLADNPGWKWWAHQFMHVQWERFGIWEGTILQDWLVLTIHWYFVYWLFKREIFLKVG